MENETALADQTRTNQSADFVARAPGDAWAGSGIFRSRALLPHDSCRSAVLALTSPEMVLPKADRVIGEPEFAERMREMVPLWGWCSGAHPGWVTGPGRSGAIAAVYASHLLKIPFVPYGSKAPPGLGRVLIVDTARQSGRTMRKAEARYRESDPVSFVAFEEPPRVAFWYEAPKPQRYRHEITRAAGWSL